MSADQVRVWVDGRRVEGEPSIEALDHGVTVGDGVFETAKVIDNEVFARTRHDQRLDRSLAGLGLPPADRERIDEGVAAVLADEPIAFGRLRYTVTAGPGPLGSERLGGPFTYIVTAAPQPLPEPTTRVAVVPWTRNERAATVGLKTTSYAENVVALAAARAVGGTEAILANTGGMLCEGTGSNIFVVVDGVILTPALSTGPLAGITRELVLQWCAAEGIEAREEELPLSVLSECDEAFLTSSTRDIQAISEFAVVGGISTAAGPLDDLDLHTRTFVAAPGPVTSRAAEVFARLAAEQLDP